MTQSRKKTAAHSPGDDGVRVAYCSRPHDIHNMYVSLKQWRIFHAVVDCGGFAEAAKALHVSQSAISYTIAKLQDQLGTVLLKIEGRKAMLTAEGRAVLERSRHVLKEAIELETFAKNLGQGWGQEIRLVVDHNFPAPLLTQALSRFATWSTGEAHVRLREVVTSQAEDILRDPNLDLAISERVPLGLLGEPLTELDYVAVAHADHQLLHLGRDITAFDLEQHVQIDMGSASALQFTGACNPKHTRRWVMNSFESVVAAVREGLGYAWLPEHRVRTWLEQGSLVRLPMKDKRTGKIILYLIHGRPWCTTPAASRLAEFLRMIASAEPPGRLDA